MGLYDAIHKLVAAVPELTLFVALALGYLFSRIPLGIYRLGSVSGTLLAAVLISQIGVHIDASVQGILFTLFIFAVGFTSGPMFFQSLGRHAAREIALALILAVSGLVCVIVLARVFGFNTGIAAGIAAGAMTQSAILGTAESVFLSINPGDTHFVADMSAGYSLTYIVGTFGTILICANLLQRFTGKPIRDDAIKAEAAALRSGLPMGKDQQLAVPLLVGRIFQAGPSAGKTVEELEQNFASSPISIERIKRGSSLIAVEPRTVLQARDKLLIIGRHTAMPAVQAFLGAELPREQDLEADIRTRDIVLTNERLNKKSLQDIIDMSSLDMRHGLFLASISRGGTELRLAPDIVLEYGDVVALYGADQDIQKAAGRIGYIIAPGNKTDFVYLGFGIACGLLLSNVAVHTGAFSLALGSCGVLFSGLIFGWFRSKHQRFGSLPSGAARLLKDLGLAGFVAAIGLNHGMEAIETVQAQGLAIFVAGLLATTLPLVITIVIGQRLLGYDNTALFAGALAGAHSSNPALGEVLYKAENSAPTMSFTVTYALANVFLTLLGPLIVLLM